MRHRANDGNVGTLLQRQHVFVVLEKDYGFPVELTRELDRLRSVDDLLVFRLWNTWEWVLEEAELELGPQLSPHCLVDDVNGQLVSLD